MGLAGKKAGQELARSSNSGLAAPASKSAKAAPGQPETHKKGEAVRADLVASSLKRLNELAAGSPDLTTDWEARAKMDEIIAKLDAAELAQVFAALGVMGDDRFSILLMKVGAAWLAKDPDAAFQGLLAKTPNDRGWLARSVFSTWAQDDPQAALKWLDSARLPEEPADLPEILRMTAVNALLERDFDLAMAEYLKMKRPEERARRGESLMAYWGYQYAGDPVMRGKLLEFAKTTGNPMDHAELNHAVLKDWPQEDSAGMMAYLYQLKDYLESGTAPAAMRPEVDGSAVAAAIYREYDQPALEWWMQRYSQSSELPDRMRGAMVQWVQKYPDKVFQWFDEQKPSPQRDALASSIVPALARNEKFEDAADTISSMQDPALRQAAGERLVFFWKEKDANAAAAWQAGQSGGGR